MKNTKAIIGILSKHNSQSSSRPDLLIREEIKDAIFHNGAVAIGILPPTKKELPINIANEKKLYSKLNSILTQKEQKNLICHISRRFGK